MKLYLLLVIILHVVLKLQIVAHSGYISPNCWHRLFIFILNLKLLTSSCQTARVSDSYVHTNISTTYFVQ
jgi:hypothetical protein